MPNIMQWDREEAARFVAVVPEVWPWEVMLAVLCARAREHGYAAGRADALLEIHDPSEHANLLDEEGATDWESLEE